MQPDKNQAEEDEQDIRNFINLSTLKKLVLRSKKHTDSKSMISF